MHEPLDMQLLNQLLSETRKHKEGKNKARLMMHYSPDMVQVLNAPNRVEQIFLEYIEGTLRAPATLRIYILASRYDSFEDKEYRLAISYKRCKESERYMVKPNVTRNIIDVTVNLPSHFRVGLSNLDLTLS